jgi:hypothetical protein
MSESRMALREIKRGKLCIMDYVERNTTVILLKHSAQNEKNAYESPGLGGGGRVKNSSLSL